MTQVPPADAWVMREFGAGAAVTEAMVEGAMQLAKDHFTRGDDGTYCLKVGAFTSPLCISTASCTQL